MKARNVKPGMLAKDNNDRWQVVVTVENAPFGGFETGGVELGFSDGSSESMPHGLDVEAVKLTDAQWFALSYVAADIMRHPKRGVYVYPSGKTAPPQPYDRLRALGLIVGAKATPSGEALLRLNGALT